VRRDRVDDPAAEASAGVGGVVASEVRVPLQLDREQVGPRIEPDDQLAALPLDLRRQPIGERSRGDGTIGVDFLRHLGA
jgi:hypothetical protein